MVSLIEEVLNEYALETEGIEADPSHIYISAISKVPFIAYPHLNKNECDELQEQTKNVLRYSRANNHCKEVAIIYDLTDTRNEKEKYNYVKGDIESVDISSDEKITQLLERLDEGKEMAVICLHNHPNRSFFYINDLLFFERHPNIKIMQLVNKDGEVAFLTRPQFERYKCVVDTVMDAEPNLQKKADEIKKACPEKGIRIADLIPDKEVRKEILVTAIEKLKERGVCLYSYINQEQARTIQFPPQFLPAITNDNKEGASDKNCSNHQSSVRDVLTQKIEYLENGEDGYGWESS